VALLFVSFMCCAQKPVIFDTDMGNDVDDALALAVLHSLSTRGECRLIGVTLTNANPSAVTYIRLVNAFYGRSELPVGSALKVVKGGAEDHYLSATLQSAPETLVAAARAKAPSEQAVSLLRRLLVQSTEKVTVVQVGFSTNLAALLESKPDSFSPLPGTDLVREKVALVSAMAGNFTGGPPEYNVKLDIPAARTVFEKWPTPIVFSGFEIGGDLLYPATSIERDFSYASWHPVAASYRAYDKMPYDRPTWDLTAALQSVRGDHNYFALSAKGRVRVADDGTTTFETGGGDRQYLRLDPAKKSRILEALTLLSSEPPSGDHLFRRLRNSTQPSAVPIK
jgi:inosine-uridine nucleoside N-ribohydrolase